MKIPIGPQRAEPGGYARLLHEAMQRWSAKTGKRLTISDLHRMAQDSGGHPYSYELFRKILAGEPIVSEESNAVLCRLLKLDERRMWRIALAEKQLRRFG